MLPIYIGQTYRYSSQFTFCIFSQQIYLIIFFRNSLEIFDYSSPQNAVYFLMLPFLVHKIFTFCINGVLNCKLYKILGTMHPIYRTDVPLLPTVGFLYIWSTNIFNFFFQTFSHHLRLLLHKMSCIY